MRRSLLVSAAVAAIWVAPGRGQTSSLRTILGTNGPAAVDRGVVADFTHAPGTSETRARRTFRATQATLDRVGRSGRHYVAGRVIVKFRDEMSIDARARAVSSVSPTASRPERPSYANFDLVRIDPNEDAEAVAALLRQRSDVEYAQAAYRVHATEFVPNDPLYRPDPARGWAGQWNLKLLDLERAWDIQPAAGSTIVVAVLDTGVAYTSTRIRYNAQAFTDEDGVRYPALGDLTLDFVAAPDLIGPNRIVAPRDFIWNDNLPIDLDGHGTHVTGTVGQLTNNSMGLAGVAFNVKIMPVKVLAGQWDVIFGASPGVGGSDDQLAQGIRYAADNGAQIINMSLGEDGPPGSSPVIEAAIRYAVGKGSFVVVAGGNGFEDGNPNQVLPEITNRVPGAVSVAAVDPAKARAFYSSVGSYIELAAPGGTSRGFDLNGFVFQQTYDFTLTDTFLLPPSRYGPPRFDVLAYVGYVGTSQSTPHVSGLAAMLMQQGMKSPAAIEAALEKFAVPCSESLNKCDTSIAPNRNNSFGFGLVEARDTLRGLGLAK